MSTGIGNTQRRILAELESAAEKSYALTVIDLAQRLGCSDRQIRRAVHSLADRDLVILTKEHGGWKGQGEYGKLVTSSRRVDDPEGDRIRYEGSYWAVPKEGDKTSPYRKPRKDGTQLILGTPVRYRIEYYTEPNGMPTGASLFVWLPDNRAKYLERNGQRAEEIGLAFGRPGGAKRSAEWEKAKVVPNRSKA